MSDRLKDTLFWAYPIIASFICTWMGYLLWSDDAGFNLALCITFVIIILAPVALTLIYLDG